MKTNQLSLHWVRRLAAAVLLTTSTLFAQPSATNHVLQFDGQESYVQLDPSKLTNLTAATIEGWVKWDSFRMWSRFFDFGSRWSGVAVGNWMTSSDLYVHLFYQSREGNYVKGLGLLQVGSWHHLAVVTGTAGLKLYLNGTLLGTHEITRSFSDVERPLEAYLGRSAWRTGATPQDGLDDDFHGQMDEVRLWRAERTEQEIRDNMFKRLTGSEPALESLWNFERIENGLVKDAGPARHDGILKGAVRAIAAVLPTTLTETREKVLELDGAGSYVRLPDDIFANLTAATVEARVYWLRPSAGGFDSQRFFSFGELYNDVGAGQEPANCLYFYLANGENNIARLRTGPILQLETWHHVAAVSGPGGMKLYLDGTLVGSSTNTKSLSAVSAKRNLLGAYNSHPDGGIHATTFFGLLDEVRIWNRERTEAEIKANSRLNLPGNEPGLVGLWNFEDGTARDSSTNAHHGQFVGQPRVVEVAPGKAIASPALGVLTGRTVDESGAPIFGASISMRRGGAMQMIANTDGAGTFRFAFTPTGGNTELTIVSGDRSARRAVVLTAGEQPLGDITLVRTLLEGSVVALDFTPIPGVAVQAVWLGESPAPDLESDVPQQESLLTGLLAEYFATGSELREFPADLKAEPTLTRIDPSIDFPTTESFRNDFFQNFYVRWTGKLRVPRADRYQFYLTADDGGRLWIDGQLVADNKLVWSDEARGAMQLEAGDHDLKVEFIQWSGGANCVLSWSTREMSRRGVPPSALFHPSLASRSRLRELPSPKPMPLETNTIFSGPDGKFRFPDLRPGWHQLRAHDSRAFRYLGDDNSKAVWLRGSDPISGLELRLPPFRKGTWRNYNYTHGLADDRVTCTAVDAEGYIWFGTLGGLSRFDGDEFVNFTKEDGLCDNRLRYIFHARDRAIWLATERGISCLRDGKFVDLPFKAELAPLSFYCIAQDDRGHLWFGTGGAGLYRFDGTNLRHFSPTDGLPAPTVFALSRGWDGEIWGAAMHSIFRFNGSNIVTELSSATLGGGAIGAIIPDPPGSYWLGGVQSLLIHLQDGRLTRVTENIGVRGITMTWPNSMHHGLDGSIWLGANQGQVNIGLLRIDHTNIVRYADLPELGSARVYGLTQDRAGSLWAATVGGGVWRHDEHRFVSFTSADGVGTNIWRALRASDGSLWFGSERGAIRRQNETFRVYGPSQGLRGTTVHAIAPASNGKLWLGTSRGSAQIPLLWNGETIEYTAIADLPTTGAVDALASTPDGSVWFVNNSHNLVGRLEGPTLHRMKIADFGLTNYVNTLLVDRENTLWLGTWQEGLVSYRNGAVARHTDQDGLADNNVSTLFSDSDGTLWVGTANGVSRFDGQKFSNLTRANSRLAANSVNSIYRDSKGAYWFGTRLGATRFDGAIWSSFDARDGLAGNDVRDICEDDSGQLWFATDRGLTRFSPAKKTSAVLKLAVAADQVHTDLSSRLKVIQGQKTGFKFSVIDTVTDRKNRWFQHAILPGNHSLGALRAIERWDPHTRNAELEWKSEDSGVYTFAVRYLDDVGNPSEPVFAFLNVVPPWYLNRWIAGPSLAAIASLLGWAFVARSLYMRKRREAEKLRDAMLEQEHQARQAAELARAEIEAKNAELAAAKVAADQASQAKSQFLANMSHELRTPLTAIIGFSEMLIGEAEAENRSTEVEDLTRINDSANHLLGLINGILDLSKIEAQKMELHLENFDLPALVRELAEMMRPLIDKKGNQLLVHCPPDLGRIRADQVKLRQCVLNLLGNANKFTERGTIRLELSRPSPALVRIAISDTGIGLTEEQITRLFQPFTQADPSTARKYGGSGLGLTITKRFCELMGGSVGVTSEPGKGSTFTIQLPVNVSSPAPEISSPEIPAVERNGKCVLVIDDDPNVHRLIEKSLKDEPVTLRFASTGEEGLRLARKHLPAVITLDVMMPHTDGWSVLSSLKADPALSHIPVVMLTIVSETEFGFALGASDYLIKPIDRNQLILALRKYLRADAEGRVLIVEDDSALRDMLRRMLEGEKWQVEDAPDGAVALERIRAQIPSVILLDLSMPVMDGFQVLAELHKNEAWRKIPVIVITALDLSQADREQLRQHTERIFEKGTRLQQELLREIRSCLEAYRAH